MAPSPRVETPRTAAWAARPWPFCLLWSALLLAPPVHGTVTGTVEFETDFATFSEGEHLVKILVVRRGGFEGNITVSYQILNETNATLGLDYKDHTFPSLFYDERMVGSSFYSVRMIELLENQVWERSKVISLGLSAEPPDALGPRSIMTIWIRDDGDGGRIVIPRETSVNEEFRFANEACAVWAERQGPTSGWTQIEVARSPCGSDFAIQDAQPAVDYFHLPMPRGKTIRWEDGQAGRKCLVGLASLEMIKELFEGRILWNETTILTIPDSLEEEEGVCFRASLSRGSSASLPVERFLLELKDLDLEEFQCFRGSTCRLELEGVPSGPQAFVAASEADGCGWCSVATAGANATDGNATPAAAPGAPLATFAVEAATEMVLPSGFAPGRYPLCVQESQLEIPYCFRLASVVFAGPLISNAAVCIMGATDCLVDVHYWAGSDSLAHRAGDRVRVLSRCDFPALTSEGMRSGGVADLVELQLQKATFRMRGVEAMRRSANGVYELCWCRPSNDTLNGSSSRSCEGEEDFTVVAGTLSFLGPNPMPTMQVSMNAVFHVSGVYGTGLNGGDLALILPECGRADPSNRHFEPANFTASESRFDFGILSPQRGFQAGIYRLCWCQQRVADSYQRFLHSTARLSCTRPEDFRVDFGEVRVSCSERQYRFEGKCIRCWYMIEESAPGGEMCFITPGRLAATLVLIGALSCFFLAIFSSFEVTRRPWNLHGMPRRIDDICTRSGGELVVTSNGLHNFIAPGGRPIPITLWRTGHFLLDSKPGKLLQFYALPHNQRRLQVVTETGQPMCFEADSSMGTVRLSAWRTLVHSTLPGLPLPLILQLVGLSGVSVGLLVWLDPYYTETFITLLIGIVVALFARILWRQMIRSGTTLRTLLNDYRKMKKADLKRKTLAVPRGAQRGLRVWKILDLHHHFRSIIRQRNMYYLDPNILQPLTKSAKLSFAEYVGPDQVEWFVSHWWGTPVSVYCDALMRHAKEVKRHQESDWSVAPVDSRTPGDGSWENTAYWICTFSNNQYNIQEELGGGQHTESSFYKALHSEGLKGTCMILDELAQPLKRSWCLFELLQTIELEERAKEETRPFEGLLFCTSNGVLNYGSSTVEISIKIGERLAELSLADAEATTEKDKKMVADLVLQTRGSFAEIDHVLRLHIRDALKACQEQVNIDFRALFARLPGGGSQPYPFQTAKTL